MAYDIYSLLVWNNLIWHHMGIFGTWSIIWWYLKHDMIKFDVIWFGIISHSPAGMMYGPLIRWLYLIYSWGHISPIWSRSNGSRSESSRSRNEWILQTLGTNPLIIYHICNGSDFLFIQSIHTLEGHRYASLKPFIYPILCCVFPWPILSVCTCGLLATKVVTWGGWEVWWDWRTSPAV